MNIRLTQIDGSLPNIAVMKIAHYFRTKGDTIYFEKSITKSMFEPEYDHVFVSAIFTESRKKVQAIKVNFPQAIVGGTGSGNSTTVEEYLGVSEYENYDYSIYPDYTSSIGFSQRGCRLRCPFCHVPKKEGKNKAINTIEQIYRGKPYPRKIILLDNDFFGQPEWKNKCEEIIAGNFKVAFIQGINIRLFDETQADYLSEIKSYDKKFTHKQIYTAWDNVKDEKRFTKGIKFLIERGKYKPYQIFVYFLCNYWEGGLTNDIWYRYEKMVEMGLRTYCMIFDKTTLPPNHDLKVFQNWINSQNHNYKPTQNGFSEYKKYYKNKNKKHRKTDAELFTETE